MRWPALNHVVIFANDAACLFLFIGGRTFNKLMNKFFRMPSVFPDHESN